MAQRLSRARATLRTAGARFAMPTEADLPGRVAAVLDVCHLVFNEGYTRTAGDALIDSSLTGEAIRLTRRLREALPDYDEVAGALALMLLTHARSTSRTDGSGDLVPLAEQDRRLWDRDLIAEGVGILERVAPSAAVTLNRAVAVGMSLGPEEGLAVLEPLLTDPAMRQRHRVHAVRAHLLEMTGDLDSALREYHRAAQLTASLPEQRYLNGRVHRLPVTTQDARRRR